MGKPWGKKLTPWRANRIRAELTSHNVPHAVARSFDDAVSCLREKLILAGPGWNRQYQTCPPMLRKV